jgi:ABC-2 type transport system permease protein
MLYLYPLLILAVSFDLTAGERERGTLRMVLAQAVPLSSLVAAKATVRAIVVAVPPIVAVAATLAAAGGPIDRGALVRAGLWLIAVIAYGLCWFGVSLIVNARGRTSSANALALAGVWLLLVVVAPTTVNLAASVLAPVPSRVEFAIATRVATRDAVADGSRVLGHFLEDHPTASNVGRGGMQQYALLQAARDADVERRLRPVLDRYQTALDAQRALVARLRFLSPAMLMQMTLLDIAGVADERHRHFVGQVEAFQHSWQAYFSPRVLAVSALGDDEYARLPAFRYQEEPVARVVTRVWTSLAVLACMGLALSGLGALAYRRYSVTL